MARPPEIFALVGDAFGHGGGIAQYNRDLFSALAERGCKISVLPRLPIKYEAPTPANIHQYTAPSSRLTYVATAVLKALRQRPPIIFCGHINLISLAAVLAKLTGAQLILQTHGIDAWEAPSSLVRSAVERADLILTVSRYTRQRILDWANLAPERLRVLPNTISEAYGPGDAAHARHKFGLSDDAKVLLSVTRLDARESYKGIENVIEALPALTVQVPSLRYVISGEGDDRPRLEQLARDRNVADHVTFMGHVPYEDLPDLYRAADLFVLPSTGEGFGIVYLEAMACGTPALGLRAGGAPDALGDGDLGTIASVDTLARDIAATLGASRADDLSAQTAARFGRPRFADQAMAHVQSLMTANV